MSDLIGERRGFIDKYGVRIFIVLALYGLVSLILDLIGWIF